ncbi:MAG: type II secretion system GspH family protein [Patescibacteria group bacterium]|nr:type II secretion system GspH family protein [Patescibacteria group bacterium]
MEKRKGFTLIELLVVIAMIAVLASTVFVVLGPARKKSRDAKRRADFKQISTAMEVCYNETSCGAGDNQYPVPGAGANTLSAIGNIIIAVPRDPVDTSPYQYTWTAGETYYYCLYTKAESLTDTWFCSSDKGVFSKESAGYTPSNTDCCGIDITQ